MSWHLGRLRAAGVVETRRQGRETVCRLREEAFAEFAARERADPRRRGLDRCRSRTSPAAAIKQVFEPIALGMGRLGLTPNGLTLIGFGDHRRRRGRSSAAQLWLIGGIVVFVGGVFDMFDGTLARATGKVSKLGAFMDSVFDRWGEAIVYLGIVVGRRRAPASTIGAGPRRGGAWARRSWSATPAPSRRASASRAGTGMAAVGVMPREIRLVILSLGLIVAGLLGARSGRDGASACVEPCDPAGVAPRSPSRSSPSAPPSPSSSGSSTSAARPSRPHPVTTTTNESTEYHVSTNGKNGKGATDGVTPTNTWAGSGRRKDGKIRVAIVGVGNCASSLVQGRYYYENAKKDDFVPGLMHVDLGGYHVRDIEFVAAFDIDKNKVGKDLSEAIYTKPNNTYVFQQVAPMGVTVERGMTHDGLGKYLSQIIEKAPGPTADIVGILKEREVDVMVSLPAGRQRGGDQVVRRAGTPGRRRRSSTRSRSSSVASRTGSAASPRPACRSSATTSRARSARRSATAC